MRNTPITPTETASLRSTAEERLQSKSAETGFPRTDTETQRLLHELQVHQIELEMQNEELRQSRGNVETLLTRYSHLYDFAPIGYVSLNSTGSILSANLTCADLLGIERSRLIGANFLRFVSDNCRASFSAALANIFENKTSGPYETQLQPTNHPPLSVRIEVVLSEPEHECLIAFIDITRSKMAESALHDNQLLLKELNESLEQRVKDEKEMREKDKMLLAQNRQAAMGEMIGCIAHQWRQPLNVLGLNIQRLPLFHELGRLDKEFLEKTVSDAMLVIKHMSQTIDDFRKFFMPDKEAVTFEINGTINTTISLIKDSLTSNQITLGIITQDVPRINGYPSEYAQVLLNIIMNAQDALLEHHVEQPCITLSSFTENGRAVVTIADNAGGVPEEILNRIFEPYFTTKGTDKGTGIGLFMAKTIIEKNMGGSLTVRNIDGGAEFRIEVK